MMHENHPMIDYAARERKTKMSWARGAVVVVGILLPYLARLPGIPAHGSDWLTSFFGNGVEFVLFAEAFNVINWGAIALGTRAYKSRISVLIAAVVGFAYPACTYATLDLASDAQAAIGLLFIPIFSLPFVAAGFFLGMAYDWFWRMRTHRNRSA